VSNPGACLQAASIVDKVPTDDISSDEPIDTAEVNPYATNPETSSALSGFPTDTGTRDHHRSSRSPLAAAHGPSTFVPISTQMWQSQFTSLVSHLEGRSGAQPAVDGDGSSPQSKQGVGSERSEETVKSGPHSASAIALQRAVEDIRHTMHKSLVLSTGDAFKGGSPVVAVPPQRAAQELFRKRFEPSRTQ
jgi:hypothetical protein